MAKPKAGKLQMLRVYSFDDLHTLPSKLWGIREPDVLQSDGKTPRENAEDAESGLEMIVMPGVAFDRSFSRLGYGKGFYDRFLSTYSGITSNVSTPSVDATADAYTSATGAQADFTDPSAIAAATRRPIPKLVAVALHVQVLDEGSVPANETDWKVDAIVSPTFQVSNDIDDIVLRRGVASTVG